MERIRQEILDRGMFLPESKKESFHFDSNCITPVSILLLITPVSILLFITSHAVYLCNKVVHQILRLSSQVDREDFFVLLRAQNSCFALQIAYDTTSLIG